MKGNESNKGEDADGGRGFARNPALGTRTEIAGGKHRRKHTSESPRLPVLAHWDPYVVFLDVGGALHPIVRFGG